MITPTVTELPRRLESVGADPFIEARTGTPSAQPAADADRCAAHAVTAAPPSARHERPRSSPSAAHGLPSNPDAALVALVHAARAGDRVAWRRLVERFDRQLRGIARAYRLAPADVDDVMQATWLRLYRHIERVREPAAIAGWLATTTRRESLRLLQRPAQEDLTDDPYLGDGPDTNGPETRLLAAERREVLDRALATLPERHRQVMLRLACDATSDYEQISSALGVPRGSIGPIRARSLTRLQRNEDLRALLSD